jgi:signal transduction histidine kinase
MTHLIDNLLTSTRLLESGAGLYFHPEEIDVREVLRDVCQLHREISPASRIVEEFGSQILAVVGDPKLLSQVFDNLLSNAVKFSPGGIVRVGASIEKEQIAIVVADTGVGIPPHDLPRLFERYYRGSNVSGIVGTGVGLNLVKMVVDLHGGDIAVDSTEGRGARFTVRLPVDSKAPADSIGLRPAQPITAARRGEERVAEMSEAISGDDVSADNLSLSVRARPEVAVKIASISIR